jgi:hypothetical protein
MINGSRAQAEQREIALVADPNRRRAAQSATAAKASAAGVVSRYSQTMT